MTGFTFLAGAALATSAALGPCLQWHEAVKVGTLDPGLLNEASGIAVSRAFPGRFYHNNDSGDGPNFYVTDERGEPARRVAIAGFEPRDVEDLALGACAGAPACLYVGDIGDNATARPLVRFLEIAETADFADTVAPLRIIEARYPDGPHNAEGFAIHPNGDLFLITKAADVRNRQSGPAQIFRLTAAQLAAPAGEVQEFALAGAIDLPALIDDAYMNQVATALDISDDGKRTLILTYRGLIEWRQDLSLPIDPAATPEPGRDYTFSPLPFLPQAEAVAYLADGDGVLYSSEVVAPLPSAPLIRQVCERR